MIRLIASDLDGTLLLNDTQELLPGTIDLIRELRRQGRIFVPASGRQHSNLKRLFYPEKDLYYVCENGARTMKGDETLQQHLIERKLGEEIIHAILQQDGCEVLVSGVHTLYVQPKEPWFAVHLRDVVKNDVTEVEDLLSVEEPYMKISICQKDGIEKTEQMWRRRFEGKVVPMISGNIWLGLMPFGADKGDGIALIQNRLHIMPEETMVFGDNFNDLAMFKRARYSFAMEKAHSDVKKACRYTTDMVEKILIDVLDGKYDEGGN